LQGNGVFVAVFWNRQSIRGLFTYCKNVLFGKQSTYLHGYGRWKRNVQPMFQVLYEEGYCWFPFPRESNSPLVPYFTALEKLLRLNRRISFSPFVAVVAAKRLDCPDGNYQAT
jgi:hypothetical protein